MRDPVPLHRVHATTRAGSRKVFREGPLAPAISASMSLPGILLPRDEDGRPCHGFLDGGLVEKTPLYSPVADHTRLGDGRELLILGTYFGVQTNHNAIAHGFIDRFLVTIDALADHLWEHQEQAARSQPGVTVLLLNARVEPSPVHFDCSQIDDNCRAVAPGVRGPAAGREDRLDARQLLHAEAAVSRVNHQRALRVFAEHLAQQPTLDGAALDELCQAHPDLEASLRQLARERRAGADRGCHTSRAPTARGSAASCAARAQRAPLRAARRDRPRRRWESILHVWDTVLERPLAMKVLDTRGALEGPARRPTRRWQRFLTEARIAGRLQHPGVVPIHDLGVDEQRPRVLHDALLRGAHAGGGLRAGALRAPRAGPSAARCSRSPKVCEVMAYAHSRGVSTATSSRPT